MSASKSTAEHETLLYEHFDSSVIITDKRIRQNYSSKGNSPSYTSMMLEDITSINIRRDGKPWVLFAGIVSGIVGIGGILEFQSWGLGGLLACAALIIYYYSSRQHVIEFRRPEGVIKFPTTYMSEKQIIELVDKVERLKIERKS